MGENVSQKRRSTPACRSHRATIDRSKSGVQFMTDMSCVQPVQYSVSAGLIKQQVPHEHDKE